jgi:hypothetical protein
MASVFISYRRADSAHWATLLFGHVSMRFGKDLVFQDVESLKPGQKWLEAIRQQVRESEVFLVVIGPQWLTLKDDSGQRRIDDAQDILRLEIGEALDSSCTVIPILVGGAKMPPGSELPESISTLVGRQGVEILDERWNEDVGGLLEELRSLIKPTRGSVSLEIVQREAYERQQEYFEILERDRSPARALESAQALSRLLDRNLPLFPHDSYLKACRAYSLKNEAMALQSLGRTTEFGELLGDAERIFRAMRSENPRDADAWNGSGSVEALRGNYNTALEYIDKCLEIDPDHEAARHDKKLILERIGKG